jgi:hypothetical protein
LTLKGAIRLMGQISIEKDENSSLTEAESSLLKRLNSEGHLNIIDLQAEISVAKALIKARLANLLIVQTEWGLEFLLSKSSVN